MTHASQKETDMSVDMNGKDRPAPTQTPAPHTAQTDPRRPNPPKPAPKDQIFTDWAAI
ncbi:MAG: hypothetical protein AAF700_12920 [Pseudomonadota bacterium]